MNITPYKVGQHVFYPDNNLKGVIKKIATGYDYPIEVEFSDGTEADFTKNGYYWLQHEKKEYKLVIVEKQENLLLIDVI